jgi:hypothetical protein
VILHVVELPLPSYLPSLFQDGPLEDPVEEFPAPTLFQLSGFWPGKFSEVANNLLLIADTIICPRSNLAPT